MALAAGPKDEEEEETFNLCSFLIHVSINVFYKFIEPSRRFVIKMDSDVRDGFIQLITYIELVNNKYIHQQKINT